MSLGSTVACITMWVINGKFIPRAFSSRFIGTLHLEVRGHFLSLSGTSPSTFLPRSCGSGSSRWLRAGGREGSAWWRCLLPPQEQVPLAVFPSASLLFDLGRDRALLCGEDGWPILVERWGTRRLGCRVSGLPTARCREWHTAEAWGWWGVSRESAVKTVCLLHKRGFCVQGLAHLDNPQVIWMHFWREQCFYRCCLKAKLYLWKYSFRVCFNAIRPLKNRSKVISACGLTASASWINPTHFITCCCLFGLFLLSSLIIPISLCFYKAFPHPKQDLKYTFLIIHVTFSLTHILLLFLSFPSISLILLPFLPFSPTINSTFSGFSLLLAFLMHRNFPLLFLLLGILIFFDLLLFLLKLFSPGSYYICFRTK